MFLSVMELDLKHVVFPIRKKKHGESIQHKLYFKNLQNAVT